MEIYTKITIPKGDFPKDMSNEDMEYLVRKKLVKGFDKIIDEEIKNMKLHITHETAEVYINSIFIKGMDVFYHKVNKLLDDQNLTKKDFYNELVKLIKE